MLIETEEQFKKRFLGFVKKTNSCWLWTGAKTDRGYGSIDIKGKTVAAHRKSYELFVGTINPGFEIDHLCRNKTCVNPKHLEAVTHRENMIRHRKTVRFCKNGHEFTKENVRLHKEGWRVCLLCEKRYVEESKRRIANRVA